MTYTEKQFLIPDLVGISKKTIEEHLKLYAGYVKHANVILDKISTLGALTNGDAVEQFTIAELRRRFGFEFDGMRNHEYYFTQFDGGAKSWNTQSSLYGAIEKAWGSFDKWLTEFKAMALTRGPGWAMLYVDPTNNTLINAWIEEQQGGHLVGLPVILALDMWEHSFMIDYIPGEKKAYVEAFFANLNAGVIEDRFDTAKNSAV